MFITVVRATVTKGRFIAGESYELPETEARRMIIAGDAEPLVTESPANRRENAIKKEHQTRWRTR